MTERKQEALEHLREAIKYLKDELGVEESKELEEKMYKARVAVRVALREAIRQVERTEDNVSELMEIEIY